MTDTNAHEYYRRTADGSIDGPHRGSTLKRMALAGTLRPDDQISKSEHGPWVPALKVQGLAFGPCPAPPAPRSAAARQPNVLWVAPGAQWTVVRAPLPYSKPS